MQYLVLGTFFLVMIGGVALAVKGWLGIWRARRSVSWPTTSGTVVRSQVQEYSCDDACFYTPDIEYSYTVAGRTYASTCIHIGMDADSENRAFATTFTSRYPVGESVRVAYNPDDPASAVLEPGIIRQPCLFVLMGLGIIAAVSWILAKCVRL